jgi:rhodanese-related sulfurtransferase
VCRYDNFGIAVKCDNIQNLLDANLDVDYQGQLILPPCQPPETAQTFPSNGRGLPGIDDKLDSIARALEIIWGRVKCEAEGEAIALIPEWWQIRAGAKRPQLLIMYRGKDQNGWTNTRRSFSVPHANPKLRKALKSIIPKTINKGAYQGIYTLKDNSKIVQYCASANEAERVLNQLERLILTNQKTGDIKTGEIKGNRSKEFMKGVLYAYEARYYATGQAQNTPDWKEQLF